MWKKTFFYIIIFSSVYNAKVRQRCVKNIHTSYRVVWITFCPPPFALFLLCLGNVNNIRRGEPWRPRSLSQYFFLQTAEWESSGNPDPEKKNTTSGFSFIHKLDDTALFFVVFLWMRIKMPGRKGKKNQQRKILQENSFETRTETEKSLIISWCFITVFSVLGFGDVCATPLIHIECFFFTFSTIFLHNLYFFFRSLFFLFSIHTNEKKWMIFLWYVTGGFWWQVISDQYFIIWRRVIARRLVVSDYIFFPYNFVKVEWKKWFRECNSR